MPAVQSLMDKGDVVIFTEKKEKEKGIVIEPGKTVKVSQADVDVLIDDQMYLMGKVVAIGDDGEIINKNPNILTDEDIKSLVSAKDFNKRIQDITSPMVLRRVHRRLDSVSKQEKVEARIRQLGKQS